MTDLVLYVPQVNLPAGVLVFLLCIVSALSQDQYSGFRSGQRSIIFTVNTFQEYKNNVLLFPPAGDDHAYEGSLEGLRVSAPPRPGENRPLKHPSGRCVFV